MDDMELVLPFNEMSQIRGVSNENLFPDVYANHFAFSFWM